MGVERQAEIMKQALETLGYVQVAKVLQANKKKIQLLLRVTDEMAWLKVVEVIKRGENGWSSHICKAFFLKGQTKENSHLVYGWNLTLTATDVKTPVGWFISMLEVDRQVGMDEPSSTTTLPRGSKNVPLAGAPGDRNARTLKGKGARAL